MYSMKKLFTILCVLALMPVAAYSQQKGKMKEIELNNGIVLQGYVAIQKDGEYKVTLENGVSFYYNPSDIKRIGSSLVKETTTNSAQEKTTKFQLEFGANVGYQYDNYFLCKGLETYGFAYSFPLNIGVSLHDRCYLSLFGEAQLVSVRKSGEANQAKVYIGFDARGYIRESKKIFIGSRVGWEVVGVDEGGTRRCILQAQIGVTPIKWMSIIGYFGYPMAQIGVTFNIPNMVRQ